MTYKRVLKLFPWVVMASLCLLPIAVDSHSARRQIGNRASSPIFRELPDTAGLKFRHYNGMTGKFFLPEVMGAGAALFDFDNDGDLDVFVVQGTTLETGNQPAGTLFPWRGPGEPRRRPFCNDLVVTKDGSRTLRFTDVTEKTGTVADGYGMGMAVGDINNDGWPDP